MTVKQLIEQLQQLDPDIHVFTQGYEGGYHDIDEDYDVLEIALDVHSDWWYGPHEDANDKHNVKDKSNYTIVKGIIL